MSFPDLHLTENTVRLPFVPARKMGVSVSVQTKGGGGDGDDDDMCVCVRVCVCARACSVFLVLFFGTEGIVVLAER